MENRENTYAGLNELIYQEQLNLWFEVSPSVNLKWITKARNLSHYIQIQCHFGLRNLHVVQFCRLDFLVKFSEKGALSRRSTSVCVPV